MAKNIIDLSEASVKTLQKVASIVTDKKIKTATERVNASLDLLKILIDSLDEESFEQITGYIK
jgi:flagellin-specific chaperone FliS